MGLAQTTCKVDLAEPSRPHPADGAARHVSRRLDEHPALAVLLGLGEDGEALDPDQRARVPTTLTHALCPPFSLVFQPQESEVQGTKWWMPMGRAPRIRWVTTGEVAQLRSDRVELLYDTREKISAPGAGVRSLGYPIR